MIGLVFVVVLLTNLVSLHSFTLSHRWIARTSTRSYAATVYTSNRKLGELYIGELPSSFSESDLKNLLLQNNISGYINATVSSYGTSDREMYGFVKFARNPEAYEAISSLKGVDVDGRLVDASFMPNTTRIRVLYNSSYDMLRHRDELIALHKNENVASVSFTAENRALVSCWSPPQTARLLHQLSRTAWKDRVCLSLNARLDDACLVLHNLDPSITQDGLTSVLNELLGPGQFDSVRLQEVRPSNTGSVAYVNVPTVEMVDKAVDILNKYKLMNRPVIAERLLRPEEKFHTMYLGNIDPEATMESIKRLCADVVTDDISGLMIRKSYKNGIAQPSCTVYFPSAELLSQCIKALNGQMWKGNKIVANVALRKTILCVRIIPVRWTKSKVMEKFRKVLGEIPVSDITWNKNPLNRTCLYRNVFVGCFGEENTNEAKRKFADAGYKVKIIYIDKVL